MITLQDLSGHPAAWRGDELFRRNDWLTELNSGDVAEIKTALHSTNFKLPHFGQKMLSIQHQLEHGSGACMLRGLPIEQFSREQARRLFSGLCSYLGTAVSQNAKGETVFDVRDEGYQVGEAAARGPNTKKRLSFHTDRCDVIAFLCLQQAKSGGENQLVSSVTLFNEIRQRRPDLLATLMQPYYYARHNVDTGNAHPWCRQPIFSIYQGHFAASFLRVLIDRANILPETPTLTDQQIEAMDFLESVAGEPELHVTFRQQPGDILLLNNWVTFHRRNEFVDYAEVERRRHLLRIWLAVPNSRPLHPDFAANFGETSAGAVRGGMRAKND